MPYPRNMDSPIPVVPNFMIPHHMTEQIHNMWQIFFILPTAFTFKPLNFLKLQLLLEGPTTLPMSQEGKITAPTAIPRLSWEVTLAYFWSNWLVCNQNLSPDVYPVSKDWLLGLPAAEPQAQRILLSPLTESFDFLSPRVLNLKKTRQASQRAEEAKGSVLHGLAGSPCSVASS